MKQFISFLLVLILGGFSLAIAGEKSRFSELNQTDWKEIQNVIAQQIAAFEQDDQTAAFSFASPAIKKRFGTAENFLRMVKLAYPAIYRPRGMGFLDHYLFRGYPMQRLQVVAPDGAVYVALYQMQKQHDGSWKVEGCTLMPTDAKST